MTDPTPAELVDLQRSAGNTAVLQLLKRALDVQRAPSKKKPSKKKPSKKKPAAPWMASKRPVLRYPMGPLWPVAELQQALNAVVPGKPLRVTGMFDEATREKVKDYQRARDIPFVTGVATKQTWWNLDRDAPRVVRQGAETVLGAGKGDPMGTPEKGTTHPTIKLGSKGPAVEELQQKLNTLPASDVSIHLSTHGKFDKTTRIGVIDFQKSRKPPLEAKGVVGKDTWAALDAVAGPVTVGRVDYRDRQRAEGTITGSDVRNTWRLLPDRLQVTVNMKFIGHAKHPKVAEWKAAITNLWNSFKFVAPGKPKKELMLEFVIGTGTPVDATVTVHKTPKNAKEVPRSDATDWHTGDDDPGLAPHEFGHLIGLNDEYNKGPEAYIAATGEQAQIGRMTAPMDDKGDDVPPEQIATEMRKAVKGTHATRGRRASEVVVKYGLEQGAYAQRVALAYEKANKGDLLMEEHNLQVGYFLKKAPDGTMADDIAARIPGRFDKKGYEYKAIKPFLYSNQGIMGTMEALSNPSGLSKHDHPIAERHVRRFLQIVQKNLPGAWRTVRR